MSRSKTVRLVAVLAAAALVVACGDDGPDTGSDRATASSATTTPAVEYPVIVDPDNGAVEIAAQPQQIVSLSPSLTEILFALGAGPQVVAVDRNSDFPAGVPTTDLSGFRPNVEAIGGYEPDLVVVSGDRDGIVAALGGLGIPTLVLGSADSLEVVYEQIDLLGTATGHPDTAELLVRQMRADIEEILAEVPDRAAPARYFYELSSDLSTVTSAGTFIGGLLGLAGLESIADGVPGAVAGFPKLSTEYVLDADPEYIFLAHTDGTGTDPAEVGGRDGWADLQAVSSGRVIVLPADISSRWGPRVAELLRIVVDATTG